MTRRYAVVAGGTSGIGRAVSLALLEKDYYVLALGKGRAHAEAFVAELHGREWNLRADAICADLRNAREVERVADTIAQKWPHLDLLVNAVGTISSGGIEKESFEDWQRVVSTNLDSMFNATKVCLPYLKRSKSASIVNISSVCSLRPCKSLSYSVSKAGVDMFTKVLANDLAKDRIRVNAVNPGVVRTNLQLSAGLFDSDSTYQRWLQTMTTSHPLGRIGEPMDVANAVLFLGSPDASWITGAILSVDGGRAVA